MHLSRFFRFSWLIQVFVGVGLFSASFLIEAKVLQVFLSTSWMAWFIAGMLESGKASAIIWHRYLISRPDSNYPRQTRFVSGFFRTGLLVLSSLCSVVFIATHLDRPNLESVRNSDIRDLQSEREKTLALIEQRRSNRQAQINTTQQAQTDKASQDFKNRIQRLESKLEEEMGNVVHGTFKGPRYQELKQRLESEKRDYLQYIQTLQSQQRKQIEKLHQTFDQQLQRVNLQADSDIKSLRKYGYVNDERVSEPHIVAFLKVTESVFNFHIEPLQFVFCFALLISLMMELGILLAFDVVTLAVLPALSIQHAEAVQSEMLRAEMSGKSERDGMRHRSVMDTVRRASEEVIEKARSSSTTQKQKIHNA